MSVITRDLRLVASVLAHDGVDVLLPGGRRVLGVFHDPGVDVGLRPRGSDAGAHLGLGTCLNPLLFLASADTQGLAEQDRVAVRGVEYLVVRFEPDGQGMTQIELMQPPPEEGTRPEWKAWR